MEEINSSIRPYDANFQYKQSLTDGTEYYRVTVHSAFKKAGSTNTDAVFRVDHAFPNHRTDLMNGKWYAFLEGFYSLGFPTQMAKGNIKVCLPDLIKSSQDYVMTGVGVCQINDAVGHVPIAQEYRAPGHDDGAAVPVDALATTPIAVSKVISADSIGVKIDPVALFSGQIRVLLRDEHPDPLVAGANANEVDDNNDGWRATLLFVHKA